MPSLPLEAIDDFVETTLNSFKRHKWEDISMELQKYHFASKWLDPKKRPEKGGPYLEWKLRVRNQGTAKHSGLFAVDDTNKINVMTRAIQPWSKQTVNYIYDIDEPEFQGSMEEIVDLMKINEQGLYNDYFELMEEAMWTAPTSDSQDPRPPSGIPFWLQKGTGAPSFQGANPSGFSSGAGSIDATVYTNWKNWAGQYTVVSQTDLIAKIVKACDYTYFEPVRPFAELNGGDPDYGFYTVYPVIEKLREIQTFSNDNLGNDAAKYQGAVYLKGIPVIRVPALDTSSFAGFDSSNPFYGINWTKFYYYFQSGRNMIKHPPKQAANQHTVRERHMDNWGNFVCTNRREGGFVLST